MGTARHLQLIVQNGHRVVIEICVFKYVLSGFLTTNNIAI